jgi:hypothetical protein
LWRVFVKHMTLLLVSPLFSCSMDFLAGGDMMTLLIKEDILPEEAVKFYAAEAVEAIAAVVRVWSVLTGFIPSSSLPPPLLYPTDFHSAGVSSAGVLAHFLTPFPSFFSPSLFICGSMLSGISTAT